MKLSKILFSLSLVGSLTIPMSVYADSAGLTTTTLQQGQRQQQSVERHSDQYQSQQHSAVDKWSEWGLTEQEWQRYEELMQGARKYWSPNLDPLTLLGVEAKNDAERQRYAQLLARKEYQRAEREIAFQIAYSRAFEQLYPGQLPFSNTDVKQVSNNMGRIVYFTKIADCKSCNTDLDKLFSYIQNSPVDIYVVDSGNKDTAIRDWAVKQKIDINKVRNRQITLNHDNGYWLNYANGKIPAAFQIQGNGQWKPLTY